MILDGQAGELPFQIRPVDETREADAILEVYRQCEDFLALGPVAQASMKMVRSDLSLSKGMGGTFCGIYERESGLMVGIVDFVEAGFEGDMELADLSLLMIAAPYRGRGLGAAVVRLVEGEIQRAGGARAIASGVQVNNPKGIRFWKRMGYCIVSGAEPMADGTVVYQLWKDL